MTILPEVTHLPEAELVALAQAACRPLVERYGTRHLVDLRFLWFFTVPETELQPLNKAGSAGDRTSCRRHHWRERWLLWTPSGWARK